MSSEKSSSLQLLDLSDKVLDEAPQFESSIFHGSSKGLGGHRRREIKRNATSPQSFHVINEMHFDESSS